MVDKTTKSQHSVLDAVDAGLIVLDRERRIVQWNAWMASASGYALADARGKRLAELKSQTDDGIIQFVADVSEDAAHGARMLYEVATR